MRHVLTEVDEAEAIASASSAEPRGHLRVLCPPAFAVHQLAKHLKQFRDRYPRVMIELTVPGPVETVDENYDVTILSEGRRSSTAASSPGASRAPRSSPAPRPSTSTSAAVPTIRATSSATRRWCPRSSAS